MAAVFGGDRGPGLLDERIAAVGLSNRREARALKYLREGLRDFVVAAQAAAVPACRQRSGE